jgi:ADP-ribose pyrophosphatase YjhB (NUDIX family)
MTKVTYHPYPDDNGKPVPIVHPTLPSPQVTWDDPNAVAVFIPIGPAPERLCGVQVAPTTPRRTAAEWETLAHDEASDPPLPPLTIGKKRSAGAVVVEPDGRVWLIEPTNHFGGYVRTFPKGRIELGFSSRATAVKEVFEESGLLVRLGPFLVDVERTTTVTRFYLATRIGGSPAAMGWEAQALWLVPKDRLAELLPSPSDTPVRQAIPSG